MNRIAPWKVIAVLAATVLAGYYLWPSYVYYSMTPAQRETARVADPKKFAATRDRAIHLGLDLQGGMHLVLEVDRSKLNPAEAKDAVDRALEVIRRRVDEFGVGERPIQREGQDRIALQLPGLTDRIRAREIVGKTALLEFRLVRTPDETRSVFARLDAFLAGRGAGRNMGLDTLLQSHPLTGHFIDMGTGAFVREQDVPTVQNLLATAGLDSILPSDSQLMWGDEGQGMSGVTGRSLYVLKRTPEMTGGSIATAQAQIGLDETNPAAWGVSLTMTPAGSAELARVSGNNIGRNLAIVLDGRVNSAPVLRQHITGGQASISGNFDIAASRDLAIVLRAGALPAPVHIVEERSVGPSLGADSIRQGLTAMLIGTLLVVIFMCIYYQLSGVIAVGAMLLNIVYVFACLAGVGATLTLPGIAGLALTVGMAVDTNVLVFERIREELRAGKSVRQAVQLGYDRAFRTILDAHFTTLFSAAILFAFGTGPIKGFAVTLSIGLIANMFTAVLFTRMIYDWMLGRRDVQRLSI
ncbi:MAG: protein translocase subunit SecD [Candidatus Eisenbacteria bacterium]|uniref:Protein translocase subunit SecD n=1 Tax=Eiseniibacteriota bacterium TaxID=2212470 RepID=A0A849SSL5_UNCEI|nr:protein translocase subunit SecD [Candidatus Eisenbacteria bacterium]